MRERLIRLSGWILPVVLCWAVFWPGIQTWFLRDDFAWLGLRLELQSWADLPRILFEPRAQGTIRPWSERAFFLVLSGIYGLDGLPFRVVAFLTQALNLVLLSWVAKRLTGSTAAGILAAALWGINANLGIPMSWSSAYNQILCSAFLLGALSLFIRYLETGAATLYWTHIAVFVAGFGALELNVVYPALAFVWLAAHGQLRARWKSMLLPALLSIAYVLLHNHFAPKVQAGLYKMHVDSSMASTLGRYVLGSFGGERLSDLNLAPWFITMGKLTPVAALGGLAVALAAALRTGRRRMAAGPAWFLVAISPVLPLRDHITDYYTMIPLMGFAMLAAWGLTAAWALGGLFRTAGVAAAAWYAATTIPVARSVAEYHRDQGNLARNLVLGVERAAQLHPGKIILLHGVNTDQFWSALNDSPFRLLGLSNVFLTPGSERTIQSFPELGSVAEHVLEAGPARKALEAGAAVVYDAEGEKLRNITKGYAQIARQMPDELPRHVDAGKAIYSDQLLEGWKPITEWYRWSERRARLALRGPGSPQERLHVTAYCPASHLTQGPVILKLRVNGADAPPFRIESAGPATAVFPLDARLVGQARIEITVEVDRTVDKSNEDASLGLVFGTFSIR